MEIGDVARLAKALPGVRLTTPEGLAEWRYHGRLVARQLDDAHLVIRADFDYRDSIRRQFPETFSVPARYMKHMMVVADPATGDAGGRRVRPYRCSSASHGTARLAARSTSD